MVDLLRVPIARRDAVLRWAAVSATDLQVVYEVYEDGEELVAWVEPLTGHVADVRDLGAGDRARIERALAAAGFGPADVIRPVVHVSSTHGTIVPLSSVLEP